MCPILKYPQSLSVFRQYPCNALTLESILLRRQIVNTIGDLQFADLTAETIISDLGRTITSLMSDHFGPVN